MPHFSNFSYWNCVRSSWPTVNLQRCSWSFAAQESQLSHMLRFALIAANASGRLDVVACSWPGVYSEVFVLSKRQQFTPTHTSWTAENAACRGSRGEARSHGADCEKNHLFHAPRDKSGSAQRCLLDTNRRLDLFCRCLSACVCSWLHTADHVWIFVAGAVNTQAMWLTGI